jgi:hypothetical protein
MTFNNTLTTPDSAGNYFVGTPSQIWINPTPLTIAAPTLAAPGVVTTSAAAILGATSITCAALTRAIAKNQTIISNNGLMAFAADAPAAIGATSITVKPLRAAVASGSVFTYFPMTPLFSVAEAELKFDGDTQEWRNFGSADFIIQARTKIKVSMTMNGNVVRNDPGMPLMLTALTDPATWLQFTYILPDGVGCQFEAYVNSGGLGSKTDDPLMRSFDLVVASDVVRANYTLR